MRSGPYRSYVYAGDQEEPPHVHVERDDGEAKFWLEPVRLQHSYGFAANENRVIEKLVITNRQRLLDSWHEYFHG